MVANGYFEAEPLVVIPEGKESIQDQDEYDSYAKDEKSKFIVVEGNRRLATIKLLMSGESDYENEVTNELREQMENLPVLFYPDRKSVLAFLGVHHLAGVRKWDVYERARYIVHLKEKEGYGIDEIQKIIGDRRNSARSTYICYRLIKKVEDHDGTFDTSDAKDNFSFLQLATGQGPIKKYIGLPPLDKVEDIESPIPDPKLENLCFLFRCLFDNGEMRRLIEESRDITNKLSRIFDDEGATEHLKAERNIDSALDMIGGEINFLEKSLRQVKSKLETVSGKLSGMDIDRHRDKLGEFKDVADSIYNTVSDIKRKVDI